MRGNTQESVGLAALFIFVASLYPRLFFKLIF